MSIDWVILPYHLILCHFFSSPQSFRESGSFPMSQLFTSNGQSTRASASVLPMDIQGWYPLVLTGLISLQSKEFSRVFASIITKHKFFSTQPSLWSNSHISTSDQIRSVAQLCPTLCNPMNHSTPGHPVHHQLTEFTQIHINWVSDVIQPSHPLSSPSPLAPNPSQHQRLYQWVNSSHEVAKILDFQL